MNLSAHPHFATALEGSYVGNCGKQPQWDLLEELQSQKSVYCKCCMETQGGHLGAFYFVIRRTKFENHASEGLTYLYTPWSRVLLEKLTGFKLVKKFLAFYGTQKFITAFTSARQLSLSCARSIQSMPPLPTSWRPILILSSHLRLGLPSAHLPQITLTPKTPLCISPISHTLHNPSHSFSSSFYQANIWWGVQIIKLPGTSVLYLGVTSPPLGTDILLNTL